MASAARRPSRTASCKVRGATQSPARGIPGSPSCRVEGVVGQAVAAVDQDGGRQAELLSGPHVHASHLTVAGGGDAGPEPAGHPGPLQADVGVGQVAGAGQKRSRHRIGADEGDLAVGHGGQPFGDAHADGVADGVVDHDRPGGQAGGPAREQGQGVDDQRVAWPRGTGRGKDGTRWPAPPPTVGPGGGDPAGVDRGRHGDVNAEPGAFGGQPVGDPAQSLSSGSDRRRGHGPAQAVGALGEANRPPRSGQDPGALQSGRPAAHDQHGAARAGAGRRQGRPGVGIRIDGLVARAGIADAGDRSGCGCHGPGTSGCKAGRAGLARDGRPGPAPPGGRRRSGPGSSPPGRRCRPPGRPRLTPGRPRCLAAPPGPVRRRRRAWRGTARDWWSARCGRRAGRRRSSTGRLGRPSGGRARGPGRPRPRPPGRG